MPCPCPRLRTFLCPWQPRLCADPPHTQTMCLRPPNAPLPVPPSPCGYSRTRHPAGTEGGGEKGRKGKAGQGGDLIRSDPIRSACAGSARRRPAPAEPRTAPNGPQRPRSRSPGADAAAARCPPPAVGRAGAGGRGRGCPLPRARSAPLPPQPRVRGAPKGPWGGSGER